MKTKLLAGSLIILIVMSGCTKPSDTATADGIIASLFVIFFIILAFGLLLEVTKKGRGGR